MKAMAYMKYGPPDVLKLTEVERPPPNDDEVLVKVHAASETYLALLAEVADLHEEPVSPSTGTPRSTSP